jgi:hypothetical protein
MSATIKQHERIRHSIVAGSVVAWLTCLFVATPVLAQTHTASNLPSSSNRYPLAELQRGLNPFGSIDTPKNIEQSSSEPAAQAISNSATLSAPQATDSQADGANGLYTKFQLAEQPQPGELAESKSHYVGQGVFFAPYSSADFAPDPICPEVYDGERNIDVYAGKRLNATQQPLIAWGRSYYGLGQIPIGTPAFFGEANRSFQRFLVYGDFRSAMAHHKSDGLSTNQLAMRLNLDFDYKLTATERIHTFMRPFDRGNQFTRVEVDRTTGQLDFFSEFDAEFDTGYFEGDLGAMWGGATGQVLPFEMPIAVGQIPLLFQNGIWMEDAFIGAAATLPGLTNAALDIPRYETTFFFGFDNITTPALQTDDDSAKIYGMTSFVEAYGGLLEVGLAGVSDRSQLQRDYQNVGISYTRRYGSLLSNSLRLITNTGQSPNGIEQTADGSVVLIENSLITPNPYNLLPYFNLFAGFDRPQSLARDLGAGGLLRNTGILFETDGLTGYPTLDASANNTYGGAFGVNLLSPNFSQQLVLETAMVFTSGDDAGRIAAGDQYGAGMRYQIPLSNSVILRTDAMVGFLEDDQDIQGARIELRKKF